MERCLVEAERVLAVRIGSVRKQCAHNVDVATECRQVEGLAAIRRHDVWIGAGSEECLELVERAAPRGSHQQRVADERPA